MLSFFHIPSYPLSTYIECLWYVDLQVPYSREKILPTGTIELMINFGSPFKNYDAADESRGRVMQESWVAGFHTEAIINEPVGETHMLGVRFRPQGAYPFFNVPLSEMTNFVLELELVWGNFAAEVRERLLARPTPTQRLHLMEHILLERLSHGRRQVELVAFAVGKLGRVNGRAVTIRDLSDEMGISQKHLINQFKKTVGVSPKQFARVLKFQCVLAAIDPMQAVNWGQVAHECHYYDQAHFNRDFKAFTGLTPAGYVENRRRFLRSAVAQGENVHFVPIIG